MHDMCLGFVLWFRVWPVLLKTMLLEVNLHQVLFLSVVDTDVWRSFW